MSASPRRGFRVRRAASVVLIVAGLLMLADVGVTLVWQEPVSAAVALIKRTGLDRRYLTLASMPLSVGERAALERLTADDARIAFLAGREQRDVPLGAALGRLVIRRIGVSDDVVQGAGQSQLELGPGHYRSTALPGLGETVAIAGHRTTYLAPFRNINELAPGDRIELQMPYATFDYAVQYLRIVTPNSWWITRNVGYERLVLSSCNPLFSAAQRIAVFAKLAGVHPNRRALARL
jgi:sortase A